MKILIEEEVVRQALEALEEITGLMDDIRSEIYKPDSFTNQPADRAITSLRDALDAAEKVEPVAMVCNHGIMPLNMDGVAVGAVLFTNPAPAKVGADKTGEV